MGDRANIKVLNQWRGEGEETVAAVWLYTHWNGTELATTLQDALKEEERWGDGSYLTRIIFCKMIEGSDPGETTGFGISAEMGDGGHKILEVDPVTQTVKIGDLPPIPFREYIELSEEKLESMYLGD